jgi:hypothetical protein
MNKIFLLIALLHSSSLFAMTKNWTVTKVAFDDAKKIYHVDFKNQAGVYKADEKILDCLRASLKDQKAVTIDFNPMGLQIKSCAKAESK